MGNGWDVRDAASFDAFVASSAPRLLRTAVLLTGDRHRGEDLLQDVLARTYLRWRRVSDPEAYVRRGLLNAQRSTWRRRRFTEHVTDEVPETGASPDHAEAQAQVDRVARALTVLTRRERAVVVLRFLEDLSEQQTAQQLDLAVGTVKSTSHRALRKLRSSAHLRPFTEAGHEHT